MAKRSSTPTRKYAALLSLLPQPDRESTMQTCVDALWDVLADSGASWVGFYTMDDGGRSMTLGAHRDKAACSPIGLHGVCGRSFHDRRAIIVRDVKTLGGDYIPCDPRDQSELVIPLFDERGQCWGVLDLDSYDAGSFTEHDAGELTKVVENLGLSMSPPAAKPLTL